MIKKNILANFIGRFWSVLSNFLFIPLYIKILGLESYSIISFMLVLNGIMIMMDAGLTATLSREFASSHNSKNDKLIIFKTLESCYFIIAVIIFVFIILVSKAIAYKWLNLENISPADVSLYLKIIGIEIGLRLLGHFYTGGFIGLEKQIKSNMYLVVYGVFRNGLVLIPILLNPSLKLFFLWQITITVLYVITIRMDMIHTLTKTTKLFFQRPEIEKSILSKVWKFAAGMMLISMVAGLNSQMDKLALSKLLSIEILGLYTLAFSLSRGLNILSTPVSVAILPRLTKLFTAGDKKNAVRIFSQAYLMVAIVVFSFAFSMALFSKELIWIWTNDMQLAERTFNYVPWISLGTSFLALQNLPFNIAVANGTTKYNNILGISSLILTLPGYWILTKVYGGVGAAITYSFVQVFSAQILLFIVNKKFMGLNFTTLFIKNIVIPILISSILTFSLYHLMDFTGGRLIVLLKIGFVVLCSLVVNIAVLIPKKQILKMFRKNKV